MIKTSKFGGTSLADAERIKNAAKIIKSDKARRYIVVSAPGSRCDGDIKITDLLYRCAMCNDACNFAFEVVEKRFREIARELKVDIDLSGHISLIRQNISDGADSDYIVSRGEYLTAIIFAKYLGFEFVDAASLIRFRGGELDARTTKELVSKKLEGIEYAVIPGFYGSLACGTIKTFSRGGSDYTGGIIAGATNSDLYENWTDVSGFRATDPKIIKNAKKIEKLSYDELYRLASMGASVLHPCSVLPLREGSIPLVIKNTFEPSAGGTIIGASGEGRTDKLAGIAVKKNCSLITFGRPANGALKKILNILDTVGGETELVLSDLLTTKFILKEPLKEEEWQFFSDKLAKYRATQQGITLLTLVGYHGESLTAKASTIIEKHAKINYLFYSGANDLIIGIDNASDLEKTLTALYDTFFT